MIKRIELTNFMSHVHTVIEPADGLTVLVGPNNCGKSAVVTALQVLCRNDGSGFAMRHGASECAVEVHTDDGHVVRWCRKKSGSPQYLIDGQPFDRLGRGLPDNVKQVLDRSLRLAVVESEREEFEVHFGTQKAPIFLLDASGSQRAQFFALSSDAIKLVEMQALHRGKFADAQREKKRLEAESKQLADELERLAPLADLDPALSQLEADHAALGELAGRIARAERDAGAWRMQLGIAQKSRHQTKALAALQPPPALAPTEPLEQGIAELASVARRRDISAARVAATAALANPPVLLDQQRLAQSIDALDIAQQETAIWQAENGVLSRLQSPPQLADPADLSRLIARFDGAERQQLANSRRSRLFGRLPVPPAIQEDSALLRMVSDLASAAARANRWGTEHQVLAKVAAPPEIAPTGELASCLSELKSASDRVRACRQDLDELQTEVDDAAAALRVWAEDHPQCPVCGAPLEADQLLDRAAAGAHSSVAHSHGEHPHG